MTDDPSLPPSAAAEAANARDSAAASPPRPALTALEARILGVLVEKQATVPDTYPLSLNALKAGCNQKNNRDPVLDVAEREIATALDELRARSLVIESSGSRTLRYEQNLKRVLDIAGAAVPLLAVLMLRGPQTAAELRLNTERLQRFADASSVEAFLRELAEHPGGPLVVELPRRSGERERRWMHRLVPDDPRLAGADAPSTDTADPVRADREPGRTGPGRDDPGGAHSAGSHSGGNLPGGSYAGRPDGGSGGGSATGALGTEVAALEARVSALEATVEQLKAALDEALAGIERPQRWG